MKTIVFVMVSCILAIYLPGCAPIETIANHEYGSGYYNLKTSDGKKSKVYAEVVNDSVIVCRIKKEAGVKMPVIDSSRVFTFNELASTDEFYGSRFSKVSIDVDLSTVITKLRPSQSSVPTQLNTNLNALFYAGVRKDFYFLKTHRTLLNRTNNFIRQIGYDAGLFAGIGITPVNLTTTDFNTLLEYDGIVFQKGIAAFITIDKLSIGIALGFDNLLDKNSDIWIYNQKPWIGLVLGIANF
jgi:hypothetical protein